MVTYSTIDLPIEHGRGIVKVCQIWVRTVPSPDPAFFNVDVPLASSFLLSTVKGKEVCIKPIVDRIKTITYKIIYNPNPEEFALAKLGTKQHGVNFLAIFKFSNQW